jgi:hypothetical protein
MSLKADQLSKSGAKGKDIDILVREHLQIIDDKLLRADRVWGRNVIQYELPLHFSIPGLEKRDGQRIIYSAILCSLKERGFDVRISMTPQRTIIFIAWVTDLDARDIVAMNNLLQRHSIAEDKISTFYLTKH